MKAFTLNLREARSCEITNSIADKCFDIWDILKLASVKSVLPGNFFYIYITLLDEELNFYSWDFRNLSWFRFYNDLKLAQN